MNVSNHRSLWVVVGALICILLIGALIVSAQSTPPSISIGENQTGSLTDASSTFRFSVDVPVPQNVNVQLLATSQGFAPAFRVFDPNNAVIFDDANAATQTIVQSQVTLASPGTYIIEVRSANNTPGQFTLSVQPGPPLVLPIPLPMQQPVTATVDPQNPLKVYSFTALTTDALFVEAASTSPDSGPVIRLVDADKGDTFGVANAHLTLGRFRMPIGTTNYLLEVTHSGSTFPESVTICLWPEHSGGCAGSGSGTGTGNSTPEAPGNNSNGDCGCEVTASSAANINIRVFPSLLAATIGVLPPNTPAQVIGELPNHSWIKINYNGVIGWVSAAAVTLSGDCSVIPNIPLTPPPGRQTPTPPPGRQIPTPTPGLPRIGGTPRATAQPSPTPNNPLSVGGVPATATPRFQVAPTISFGPTATPHLHAK